MKKIVAFIVVFLFIYPVFPKIFPIPLDRCLQLIGIGVLFLHNKDLKRLFTSRAFVRFFGISFLLLLLALFASLQVGGGPDFYFVKEVLNAFFSIFSAYLVCWSLRRAYGSVDVGLILYYIALAAVIQTIISGIFFINNTLFHAYLSLLKEETNQGILSRVGSINKRFIGLGSQFFSGVIKYGIAFFSVLILPYVHTNILTKNRIIYWISVLLIATGGILTGRTFFVAIAIGVAMIVSYKSRNLLDFISHNLRVLISIILSLPLLYFVATSLIDMQRFEVVFNFVFELFVNLFVDNEFETVSTNRMQEMYIYPNNIQTWLFGDGKMMAEGGGYYMGTDIGFIRLMFYFGLPATVFFVFVLYKYFRIVSKQSGIKAIKYFLFSVTVWMLILNFKGLAFESHYYVLFLLGTLFPHRAALRYGE